MTNSSISGAGILPYAIVRKSVYILLGKERFCSGWRYGSNKWSYFSGKAETDENEIITAAREFVEETMGIVSIIRKNINVTVEHVAWGIENGTFSCRVLNSTTLDEDTPSRKHVCYVMKIPFQSQIIYKFNETRSTLMHLMCMIHKYIKLKSSSNLCRMIFPGYRLTSTITCTDLNMCNNHMIAEYYDESLDEVYHVRYKLIENAIQISSVWHNMLEYVNHLPQYIRRHPAIGIHTKNGKITYVTVRNAYMEKQEIKWFKIDDLNTMIDKNPFIFRDNFIKQFKSIRCMFNKFDH